MTISFLSIEIKFQICYIVKMKNKAMKRIESKLQS